MMPKRELLTSASGPDGLVHAFYPSADKTLCLKHVPKRGPGRPAAPTCEQCVDAARAFHSVDGSCPPAWLKSLRGQRLARLSAAAALSKREPEAEEHPLDEIASPSSEPPGAASTPPVGTGRASSRSDSAALKAELVSAHADCAEAQQRYAQALGEWVAAELARVTTEWREAA